MKRMATLALLVIASTSSNATNIILESTPANCKKAASQGSISSTAEEAVAAEARVSMASVRHMYNKWEYVSKWGGETCAATFDTAKGPVKCMVLLLSSNKGKTAFGAFEYNASQICSFP